MVAGPSFIWHIDGYDELKPQRFSVHGTIDGNSRRILWLEVSTSKDTPMVTVRQFGGSPRCQTHAHQSGPAIS